MSPELEQVVIPALISAGGAVGSKLVAGQGQRFSSFSGTSADPLKLLTGSNDKLKQAFDLMMQHATTEPDLSDSYVQDVASRGGDTLPMDFGTHRATWDGGSRPPPPAPSTYVPSSSSSADDGGGEGADMVSGLLKTMFGGGLPPIATTGGDALKTAAGLQPLSSAARPSPTRLKYQSPMTSPMASASTSGQPQVPPSVGAVKLLLHAAGAGA